MVEKVQKRSGEIVTFDKAKVTSAIFKAAHAVGGSDMQQAKMLTENVLSILHQKFENQIPTVEEVQDIIEKVLIETGHASTAKAFILYRAERMRLRDISKNADPAMDAMFGYKSKLFSLVPHEQVDA